MKNTFQSCLPMILVLTSLFNNHSLLKLTPFSGSEICQQHEIKLNDPAKGGTVYGVSSIAEFDWLKGNYAWVEPSKQRLLQSQFIFNSGGNFTYVLPYDNTTTYRLVGTWWDNDAGGRSFEGSTGSSNGAGSGTSILISGRTYAYAGQTRATISYVSGANYYAKVNNSEFVNSASKRFNAKVVLSK